jgi:serine/threonine-protein kinase RsbW
MGTAQTTTFPGKFSSLGAIAEFVARAAESAHLDEATAYAVQMAVDEACSNIIEHAYGDELTGDIVCTLEVKPDCLVVTLRDQGRCFDPMQVSEPDLDVSLQNRAPGGLGVYFMRQLMDRVEHCFVPGTGNVLTMVKWRSGPS